MDIEKIEWVKGVDGWMHHPEVKAGKKSTIPWFEILLLKDKSDSKVEPVPSIPPKEAEIPIGNIVPDRRIEERRKKKEERKEERREKDRRKKKKDG